MANGTYVERGRALSKHYADDADDSSSDDEDEAPAARDGPTDNLSLGKLQTGASPALSATTSESPLASSVDLTETASFVSAPATLQTNAIEHDAEHSTAVISVTLPEHETEPSNAVCASNAAHSTIEVPLISMTEPAPDTPIASSPGRSAASYVPNRQAVNPLPRALVSSPSRDSLKLPAPQHCRHPAAPSIVREFSTESNNTSSEDSDIDIESDIELSTSVQSETSSVASREESPPGDMKAKGDKGSPPTVTIEPPDSNDAPKPKSSKASRAKQVIPRRAFKRYLIAKPPPVLVIHLKRFQQVGKPTLHASYFSNLKKLDDNVAFPEYLDLTPFLLPKKEEFGLGKSTKQHDHDAKLPLKAEKCMYRLFAVVVHIGNMLGGHYIAYTALPDSSLVPNNPRTTPINGTPTTTPSDESSTPQQTSRPSNSRTNSFQTSADPKTKPPQSSSRKWCYISDTIVKLTTLEEVMKSKAYICMYERI